MPELPEVENVARGLRDLVPVGARLKEVRCLRRDLRFPLPQKQLAEFCGKPLRGIQRRSKYLIFEFEAGGILSHLGMTGSWRRKFEARVHDHVEMEWSDGLVLVYNDPRRFGFIEAQSSGDWKQHPRLQGLGPEPLSSEFTVERLRDWLKGRSTPVKAALLDQAGVAGLGNIYVLEALFLAGIRPTRKAARVTFEETQRLWKSIREVLDRAITAGGSTIRDYRGVHQEAGTFQDQHWVYGREAEPCRRCESKIRHLVQSGRTSTYCPTCQK